MLRLPQNVSVHEHSLSSPYFSLLSFILAILTSLELFLTGYLFVVNIKLHRFTYLLEGVWHGMRAEDRGQLESQFSPSVLWVCLS